MACECKDENGSLMSTCLGVCSTARTVIIDEQKRAHFEETLHGDLERLATRISALAQQIANLPKLVIEANQQGFMEGFTKGFEAGRDYL